MKYIGHSTIYYQGAHGYKLCVSDDGSFYSVYFDCGLPVIRILSGKQNCLSQTQFVLALDVDIRDPWDFNPDLFVKFLIEDLEEVFDIKVGIII